MWLEIYIIFWAMNVLPHRCSVVITKEDQKGIYVPDYCPRMRFCAEGAHVMCMYYNPKRVHGTRCNQFKNISITPDIADNLLSMVNEMRGRVAMGIETGHNNVTLPRGFGMFQLKWDNELATFAQVLANTCILRHDLCRATKQFPDPGQLASLVRFTIPDWLPVLHRDKLSEKGFSSTKINYAAREAYKSWYNQKQHVTLQMIENVPDWVSQPSRTQGKMFLQLIDGKATHMGCGISAYVEYAFHGKSASEIVFNSIHVICNFSSQPQKGTSAYNMNETNIENPCHPLDKKCSRRPYTSKCGCPPGTAEDDRCLCTDPVPYEPPPCRGKNCKPAVVLLPIFTVEDAPQELISQRQDQGRRNEESPNGHPSNSEWGQNDIIHSSRRQDYDYPQRGSYDGVFHKKEQPQTYLVNSIQYPFSQKHVTSLRHHQTEDDLYNTGHFADERTHHLDYNDDQPYHNKRIMDVKNRYFNGNHLFALTKRLASTVNKTRKSPKESIFARAKKFGLRIQGTDKRPTHSVVARKDFSDAKKALGKYLNEKLRQIPIVSEGAHDVQSKDLTKAIEHTEIVANEHLNKSVLSSLETINQKSKAIDPSSTLNSAPISKVFCYTYLNETLSKSTNPITEIVKSVNININEDPDKKLMSLLDSLEQEVKVVDLDVNEKQIFDAKLKKIYGYVVGKKSSMGVHIDTKGRHHDEDLIYADLEGLKEILKQKKRKLEPLKKDIVLHRDQAQYLDDGPKNHYVPTKDEINKKRKALFYESDADYPVDDPQTFDRNLNERYIKSEDRLLDELHSKEYANLYFKTSKKVQNAINRFDRRNINYVPRNTFNNHFKIEDEYDDFKYFDHLENKHNHLDDNENRFIEKDVRSVDYIPNPKPRYRQGREEPSPTVRRKNADQRRANKLNGLKKYSDYRDNVENIYTDNENSRNFNHNEKIRSTEEIMSVEIQKGGRFSDFEKENGDDSLSLERKKFYQEKLDILKKSAKPQHLGNLDMNRERDHQLRRIRGHHTLHLPALRPSQSNTSHQYYIPDRALFSNQYRS